MALASVLRKALKRPELMMALLGAGVGGALDKEDPLTGALAGGAALGGGTGALRMASRGLLGRVPASPADIDKAILKLRGSIPGITPQQASQFPPNTFRDEVRQIMKLAEGRPRTLSDPDLYKGLGRAAGMGALGAAGIGGSVMLGNELMNVAASDDYGKFVKPALEQMGYPPTSYGVRMFQLEHADKYGMAPTGQIDSKTLDGVLSEIIRRRRNKEVDTLMSSEGPPAPSLAPHNRP